MQPSRVLPHPRESCSLPRAAARVGGSVQSDLLPARGCRVPTAGTPTGGPAGRQTAPWAHKAAAAQGFSVGAGAPLHGSGAWLVLSIPGEQWASAGPRGAEALVMGAGTLTAPDGGTGSWREQSKLWGQESPWPWQTWTRSIVHPHRVSGVPGTGCCPPCPRCSPGTTPSSRSAAASAPASCPTSCSSRLCSCSTSSCSSCSSSSSWPCRPPTP